jgi:hypothetical protein
MKPGRWLFTTKALEFPYLPATISPPEGSANVQLVLKNGDKWKVAGIVDEETAHLIIAAFTTFEVRGQFSTEPLPPTDAGTTLE